MQTLLTNAQQFSRFRRPRSEEEHDAVTRKLVVSVLLGDPEPWEKSQFKAFKDGFNISLGSVSLLHVCAVLSDLRHSLTSANVRPYNLRSPSSVTSCWPLRATVALRVPLKLQR
jgi:hypothetical protein